MSEVFAVLDKGVQLNIEIKERGLENQVLTVIPPSLKQNIIISSFEGSVIEKVKALDADVRTALIVGQSLFTGNNKTFSYWHDYFPENRLKKAKADIVCPHFRIGNKLFVQRMHRKGYEVYVWTVNHPEKIKKIAKTGADGIFTDNIKTAVEQRK
ncbi:glycerophosphodiester phosphodiesterase [Salibacterium salarium]|uniref:glycerophosphodiester phosphodiesterase n=1 Tax=Salibacterium salarium TaxID=284579 RepID=UPI00163A05A4|nr:glycerophosphodiester phosphodiesterase [Salibacterium salarium]